MTSRIVSISEDNIKVSYVGNDGVLIENASVSDANDYEKLNPGTIFVFVDGDNNIRYLNIEQVNSLTSSDLISTKSFCDTSPKPARSPIIIFSGGGGIGAAANPVISPNGTLLSIDVINSGLGYQTPPSITVIDEANVGSGAVVQATVDNGLVSGGIVLDSGSNYIPSQYIIGDPLLTGVIGTPTVGTLPTTTPTAEVSENLPRYPVLLGLKEIIVNNAGINYNPGIDVVEISPNNGAILQTIFTPFGQVSNVKVIRAGIGYTFPPNITIRSDSGVNADFTPVFEIIRDPILFNPQLQQREIITVVDTVGLQVQGYVSGKPYYGNIYYDGGLKYAGPYKSFDSEIRVYDTLSESIK